MLGARIRGRNVLFSLFASKQLAPRFTQRNPGRCHGNRSNSRELKLLDLARLTMHVTHSLPSCKSARTDPRLVQARRSRLSGDLEQITSSEPPACSRPPLPAQKIWTKENI